jgi:hypothetical protein
MMKERVLGVWRNRVKVEVSRSALDKLNKGNSGYVVDNWKGYELIPPQAKYKVKVGSRTLYLSKKQIEKVSMSIERAMKSR